MKERAMTYAFVQDVPIDEQLYKQVLAQLGDEPLAGLVAHVVLRNNDQTLRYVDVWESEEACEQAFDERIHPAVHRVFQERDFRPDGEPPRGIVEIVDVLLGDESPRR